jgi:hypothetical protein
MDKESQNVACGQLVHSMSNFVLFNSFPSIAPIKVRWTIDSSLECHSETKRTSNGFPKITNLRKRRAAGAGRA